MKKSLCLLLSATLAFSMTACTGKKEANNAEPTTAPTITQAPATEPSGIPTEVPISTPTAEPTAEPSLEPTAEPDNEPTQTVQPTNAPTKAPSKPNPTSTPKPTSTLTPTNTPNPTKAPTATPEAPEEKKSLEDMMSAILEGVELPMIMNTTIDENNFSYYLNMDIIPGAEGLASDAAIMPVAHSVVLLRIPKSSEAKSVAKDVKANANPGKWICTSADKVSVSYKDDVILLVMSTNEITDAIIANFENQ